MRAPPDRGLLVSIQDLIAFEDACGMAWQVPQIENFDQISP